MDSTPRRPPPGFLLNGLPKAGTHLLMKAVELLHDVCKAGIPDLTQGLAQRWPDAAAPCAPIGVDWPRPVPLERLRELLQRVRRKQYAMAHTGYSAELAALLDELDMPSVLILRDPRDLVVSHATFIAATPDHFLHETYRDMSPDARLLASIRGLPPRDSDGAGLRGIGERYRACLAWKQRPRNWTTSFERLVGATGGGDPQVQRGELETLVRHLGFPRRPAAIERTVRELFGGTRTFRRGRIGGWREHLGPVHLQAIEEEAGDLLEWFAEGATDPGDS